MSRKFLFLSACAVAFFACESQSFPPASRCEGVRCTGVSLCNPVTGACEVPDAGLADGGEDGGTDAGVADAGAVDAGSIDAGTDAGVDAGFDAGPPPIDAGPAVDAGCHGDVDCQLTGATPHCRLDTGACVECVDDSNCIPVAPKCDPVGNKCFECLSNVNCANPTPVCDRILQCLACTSAAQCGPGWDCDALGTCKALPDACGQEKALNLPAGTGTVSFAVDPSLGLDNAQSLCNAAGGPELVYTFTTTTVQDLSVTAAALAGSSARPSLFLRQATCLTGTEKACDAPAFGSASLAVPSLPVGTWYLFVESTLGGAGRVQVTVRLTPPVAGVANDNCAAPQALSFVGNTAVVVGTTATATNDAVGNPAGTCSPSANNGPDLTYQLTVAQKSSGRVTVRPLPGSALHAVVSLRTTCSDSATEQGCIASTAGGAVTLNYSTILPGQYTVWVDSADATTGAFQLEVVLNPLLPNDACSGTSAPEALTFVSGTATTTGDTTNATNGNLAADASPSCSPSAKSSGKDLLYTYTLPTPKDVTITVTPTGATPTYQPVVYVRSAACSLSAAAAEVACANPAGPTAATLALVNQPADTYYVWVDGSQDTAGPFQLQVTQAAPTPPPANDTCATAQALTLTAGHVSVAGTTLQAANDNNAFDVSPTCSPTGRQSGRDVIYSVTLTQPQDLTVTVTPTAGSALHPALYVRSGSCTSQLYQDEQVCLERVGVTAATLTRLPAGTYWIWVDGAGGTAGNFTLDVTAAAPTPAPANDGCTGAQALSFVNGAAVVQGTMVGASNSNSPNDNAPGCGTNLFPKRFGRDVVFTYTLTQAQDVEVRVTPSPGSLLSPVLYVRPGAQCTQGGAGNELACIGSAGPGISNALSLANQPAGTYALFVDSDTIERGDFILAAHLKAATAVPGNDTCAAPAVIPLGASGVSGSTVGAKDSYSSTSATPYGAGCGRSFLSGRDVVYQVTATATGQLTATLTPKGSFDAALLMLQPTCGPAACVRASDVAGPGGVEQFSFPAVAGATYFFVVDAYDSSMPNTWGDFTLAVQ